MTGGLRVIASFEHDGVARRLVHLLKYRGVTAYAGMVASILATRLPALPLVPIPRALSRTMTYGIDPAFVIAREVSARNGQPVIRALGAPIHTRRRAGGDHHRPPPTFGLRKSLREPVILVDDVVTTGGTILSATNALGADVVAIAAAANAVLEVTSLRRPAQINQGGG
ncbi:MAG TPA: hypothetical protein VFZ80_01895 [Acidimicrobiia bacterium]